MAECGVTEKGFVIKRLDEITEEIHADLTEAYGFDTRMTRPSFLDTLITTFAYQVAELWEVAQDSYYAKYPATATGLSLDNAVQYGGIRRAASRRTSYPLHCTGEDGTYVRENAVVATDTSPEVRLRNREEFQITRESFNRATVKVASCEVGAYTVTINGAQYAYSSEDGDEPSIIAGLANAITDEGFEVRADNNTIIIEDKTLGRSSALALSDNLTTESVTTIAVFETEDYGSVTLPRGIATRIVNDITGLESVTNLLEPTYGRQSETDAELRQSYIAKSALRSNTMIGSIVAELLNNVENVESASGYENDTDIADARGLPPHSIEIVVEGGDDSEIAQAILRRKAGGIQTYGSVSVDVPGLYGDIIPVRFNRPDYLYAWLKVVLHGDRARVPSNYAELTVRSLLEDGASLAAGGNLLTQLLNEGIYSAVAGLTYVEISTACKTGKGEVPDPGDYEQKNIIVTSRQKIIMDEMRIEVSFVADN